MSTNLKELLGRFRAVGSVELAAVVATDGLLIESSASPEVDVDAIGAVASNGLAMAEALGREVARGSTVQTMVEYEDGLVLLEPIGAEAMLLLLANNRDDLGYVRFLVAKHRDDMLDALSAI
jgi:predicted regulator of Ras-like GTPase activity (Roadblock/LC7/MglB family)